MHILPKTGSSSTGISELVLMQGNLTTAHYRNDALQPQMLLTLDKDNAKAQKASL